MDLIAKLPVVAATIYNNLFREGATPCPIDPEKDWSHNFTSMIGYEDPMFTELMRLYLTIHRSHKTFILWCKYVVWVIRSYLSEYNPVKLNKY